MGKQSQILFHFWVVASTTFLSWSVTYGQSITVTLFDQANFQGARYKQVTVNRCTNLADFDNIVSSYRTTGCVQFYIDRCCRGRSIISAFDLASLPANYDNQLTSVSPCGNYSAPFPAAVQEKWLGHSQPMLKVAEDGDIAIYYNNDVQRTAVENHKNYIKKVWTYVKRTYGDFGPEGGRLSAFFHANVGGIPGYGFSSIQNYFDLDSDCRNLIDVVQGGRDGWSKPLTGTELDVVTHEISHIVEGASKGMYWSPSYQLWGDSKWAQIFIYDVYNALGMFTERDRAYRGMITNWENFPRPNTYWFRDWFYPIYSQSGGAWVLNNYFTLLSFYFPRNANGWQYDGRTITLGEHVHFFSGAAGRDLKPQAVIAFKWDAAAEAELQKAKIDFPHIKY